MKRLLTLLFALIPFMGFPQATRELVTGIADDYKPLEAKIYPNPTRGMITIDGDDVNLMEIYNHCGWRVASSSEREFNFYGYPNGVYVVVLYSADRKRATVKKLILR